MSTVSPPNSRSTSVRAYRALLVAYPKKFREHYETQMVQVFRDSFRDAYERGGTSGAIDLWIHTCADLLVSALIERVAEGSHNMFSPKIVFWGGLASVFGGLLWCTLLFSILFSMESGNLTLPAALVLTFVGLAALHASQGRQAGTLSRAGFVLGIIGTAMTLWFLILPQPGNPARDPGAGLQFADFALGMSLLGIGQILIGLRMPQTGFQSRSTTVLAIAIGALHIGFGISIWILYDLMLKGINPWNPMRAPVTTLLYCGLAIGILWIVLGAILAGQSRLLAADQRTVTAQTPQ